MKKSEFVIYGCPYTAFEAAVGGGAYLLQEPDRTLFHFGHNTNRIVNLVGFSGLRKIRLIGCSEQFVETFKPLLAEYKDNFRVSVEPKTRTCFPVINRETSSAGHLIVTEMKPELLPIAYQLAGDIGGCLMTIDAPSEQEAADFSEALKDFEETTGLARQNGLERCRTMIRMKLGDRFLASTYSSVTFLTEFPYNLYPFRFATAHLYPRIAADVATACFLKVNANSLQTGVAIILDSGKTQSDGPSEAKPLREWLSRSYGILPTHNGADLGDFRYLIEDMPADLMFLTAHCGEMPGITLEATFSYKGKSAHVRYAVNRGVSAVASSGLVDCQTSYLPLSVNGVNWKQEDCERGLFWDFAKVEMDASLGKKPRNAAFEQITITRAMDAKPVKFPVKCIECGDGQPFVPLTNTIGAYYFPLVFNNACASYCGVSNEFLPDVSFYIGTTRPVDSFSAVHVGQKFVENLGRMSVANALFAAQSDLISEYTPYLLAGVPWLSMPTCATSSIAIMKANSLLKTSIQRQSTQSRDDHRRVVFLDAQRRSLLKQLFSDSSLAS